jgi:hypothetical protein
MAPVDGDWAVDRSGGGRQRTTTCLGRMKRSRERPELECLRSLWPAGPDQQSHTSTMAPLTSTTEATARRYFETLLPKLTAIAEFWEQIGIVESGSRLGRDDAASAPFGLSGQVSWLANVSIDNIEATRDQIVELKHVRSFALYSQLRASIEASANGLWLLTHSRLTVRLQRHLAFVWSNHEDFDRLVAVLGLKRTTAGEVRSKIDSVRVRHKSLQQFDLDKNIASISDRIRDVQNRAPVKSTLSPLAAWSACSGLLHGNQVVGLGLLERQEEDPNVFRITTSMVVLTGVFDTAIETLDRLTEEYRARL